MNLFKLNIFACFTFLFIINQVSAQDAKVVRLEVPANIDIETYHVVPIGSKGVLIFYQSNEINEESERKWYFGLFDTSLKQIWLKFIPLSDKMEYVDTRSTEDKLHLLFRNITRGRFEEGYYEIVNFEIASSIFTKVSGTFPIKAEIAGFEAMDNTACIALNLDLEATDLVFVNLVSGDITPVHIKEESESYCLKLHADKQAKRFFIALKTITDNRYINDEIVSYTVEGNLDKEFKVDNIQAMKTLSDYVFLPYENDQLTVLGTYAIITGKVNSFKDLEETDDAKGAGMFFLRYKNDVQSDLKFYDFLSFDNIYGSLGSRKMEVQRGNKNNEDVSGKVLTAYYYLINPEVIKANDQYIFSVEIYKPFYQTETRMDYDYYGRPVPYTYSVFSGYSFYDVIFAGLSEKGDLIWNNDTPINNLKTYKKVRQSLVFADGPFVSSAYVNDGDIFLQTIEGPVDIGKANTEIKSKISKDKVSDDEFNTIVNWYDEYFLVSGYQKLKNRSLGDQNLRTVFYINKVAYR